MLSEQTRMEAAGHSRMLAPLPSTQSTVPTHHSLGFPHLKGQTALLREEQQMGQEMGSSALLPGVKPQGGPSPITPMVPTAPVQPWEKSFPKAELLRRKQLVFSSRPLITQERSVNLQGEGGWPQPRPGCSAKGISLSRGQRGLIANRSVVGVS